MRVHNRDRRTILHNSTRRLCSSGPTRQSCERGVERLRSFRENCRVQVHAEGTHLMERLPAKLALGLEDVDCPCSFSGLTC